jgi:protein SCO1/2
MTHTPGERRPSAFERRISRLAGSRLLWVAVIGASVAIPLAKAFTTKLPPLPAVFRTIPEFTLVNQDGREFGTQQLRGRLWVANFIFTSCRSVCPALTHAMEVVRKRSRNMAGAVQFVSISVDPRNDTPSVLSAYSQSHHGGGTWNFLTGSIAEVKAVVLDGFGIRSQSQHGRSGDGTTEVLAQHDEAAELLETAHGQQLVLVDQNLNIRGFYNPDDKGIDKLMLDMGLVANLEGVKVMSLDPPAAGALRTQRPPSPKSPGTTK